MALAEDLCSSHLLYARQSTTSYNNSSEGSHPHLTSVGTALSCTTHRHTNKHLKLKI